MRTDALRSRFVLPGMVITDVADDGTAVQLIIQSSSGIALALGVERSPGGSTVAIGAACWTCPPLAGRCS